MSLQPPPNSLPWPHKSKLPNPGGFAEVADGLYHTLTGKSLEALVCCRSGKVVSSLRITPNANVRARYENCAFAQEYQQGDYLEDFGGRIEGPAYPAEISFEQWLVDRLHEVKHDGDHERGFRPVPDLFLNPPPAPEFPGKPVRRACATAKDGSLFPCVLQYSTEVALSAEDLARAAASLYLEQPHLQDLECGQEQTGFSRVIEFTRITALARQDDRVLGVSVVYPRQAPSEVIVGLHDLIDREHAAKEVLAIQKLFLQKLRVS